MGHMKSLFYKIPVYSVEDLLTWVMAVVDVGLQGTDDHVYENMVHRYCVCFEVTGHHIEPFF